MVMELIEIISPLDHDLTHLPRSAVLAVPQRLAPSYFAIYSSLQAHGHDLWSCYRYGQK
jgi:hypothetical protein